MFTIVCFLLGGFLIEQLNWRYIFFINLPLGTIAFIGLVYFLEADKPYKSVNHKVNFTCYFYLCLSVASLQIFLDRGELEDWFNSEFIIFLI